MKEKELDQLIQQAIEQETELPEGLSQRLEQFVDKLPESPHTEVPLPIRKRPALWVRYARIAAAIVVAVLFYYLPEDNETTPKDTFSDPQEAALYAQQRLTEISLTLNQGISQMKEAREEMKQINQIVNNQLNSK